MAYDPWDKKYLYYTNEDPIRNSIMQWNTETMELDAEIEVGGTNPHSVDRACYTDKMYVRTQGSYSFDVVDMKTRKYIKSVDLPFKPRTCGDQNYKHNLQLVAGTSDIGVALIDVETDEVIFTDWESRQDRPAEGNQGGSTDGHAAWFDDDHFGYINRIESEIKIFKVYPKNKRKWQVRYTQRIDTATALHTIQDDKIDVNLTEKYIYGAVEGRKELKEKRFFPAGGRCPDGSYAQTGGAYVDVVIRKGVLPGIQKFRWDGNRLHSYKYTPLPNSSFDDTIHHYSISPDKRTLWVPTFKSRKTHVLRLSDMRWIKQYVSGYGGGHVNFSSKHPYAVITNHFDDFISVLRTNTSSSQYKIHVNNDIQAYPNPQGLLQTHSNWISKDGRYFYFGNSHSGELVEIDLDTLSVSRKLFVGGHPEQSIS